MPGTTVEQVAAALVAARIGAAPPSGWILHALGWATVELDRAAFELARDLGFPAGRFRDADGSVALGARCRVVAGALPDGLFLAILEPATEGRIAAALARFGEGLAVAWYRTGDLATAAPAPEWTGPFGLERLVSRGPAHGPHRFLIGPAAVTIPP